MKKTLISAIATASVLATSTYASAAQPVFYTGLSAGWNATEFEASTFVESGGDTFTGDLSGSASGPAFGGVLGAKLPINTGYIALEANIADSGAEYEATESINGQQTLDETISSDLSYGITGILAFNVNSHSQLYGLLGYQVTDIELKASTRDTGTGAVTNGGFDDSLGGVRVGLGLETMLTSALSARVEWTQTNYSSEDFTIDTAAGATAVDLKASENRVTIGIIGHF